MTKRGRHRLRMGFKDDFDVIEVKIVRIEAPEGRDDFNNGEEIEWLDSEETVTHVRVKSGFVLGVIAILLTFTGFI